MMICVHHDFVSSRVNLTWKQRKESSSSPSSSSDILLIEVRTDIPQDIGSEGAVVQQHEHADLSVHRRLAPGNDSSAPEQLPRLSRSLLAIIMTATMTTAAIIHQSSLGLSAPWHVAACWV